MYSALVWVCLAFGVLAPAATTPKAAAKAPPRPVPSKAATATKPGTKAPATARGVQPQNTKYNANGRYNNNARRPQQAASTSARRGYVRPRVYVPPVQMQPSQDRYREIQTALAQKGYLRSEPTGSWDAESSNAMKQFQRDQNIEADGKLSSLSLIALGLGPKRTVSASSSGSTPVQSPPPPVLQH